MNKKGEMGIGTMILFIAMVLVAAVAAALLISTAGSLNQQAQETGRLAQQDVSSGFVVEQVLGVKNRAYWQLDWDSDGDGNDGMMIVSKEGGATSLVIQFTNNESDDGNTWAAGDITYSSPTITVDQDFSEATGAEIVAALNSDVDFSTYCTAYAEGDGSGAIDELNDDETLNSAAAVDNGDDEIGDLFLKIRLNAGSPKVDMDNVVVNVMSDSYEASLTYEEDSTYYHQATNEYYTVETPDLDPGYLFSGTTGGTANGGVVRDPDALYGDASSTSGAHIVSQGTMLMVHINVDYIGDGSADDGDTGLEPQDTLTVKIIPKHGSATTEIVNIPESLIYTYNVLA